MKLLVIILLLLSFESLWAKNKKSCSKKELKLKNCHLKLKKYKLDLVIDGITIDDKVWRSVIKVPVVGESTEWKSIKLFEKAGRFFLSLEIWENPERNINLQKLNWSVYELQGEKAYFVTGNTIQMRRKETSKEGTSFIYDPQERHGISLEKNKIFSLYKNKKTLIKFKKPKILKKSKKIEEPIVPKETSKSKKTK